MGEHFSEFDRLLDKDGPVAIVVNQCLRPVDGDSEPIFPPTYLMPTYNGRVHTVRDGEYRVSVELPPNHQDGKKDGKSQDSAGYNIDYFPDGSNVCEIDSPQSQANRIEPLFETIKGGRLVPQIRIQIGSEPEPLNLLRAGHRAADAVVRLSSLVEKFHEAFKEVRRGNHHELARLAPTSILFGVWDSRGTQVKLQRIFKSEIRATNVRVLTKSAVFSPAAGYVDAEAIDADLDQGEGDKNPLSSEGMKHAPASRTPGGVEVKGDIRRSARINLVALRDLRAHENGALNDALTTRLQRYLLGLALVAASRSLQLNLREGCLLCGIYDKDREAAKQSSKAVYLNGNEDERFSIDPTHAENYAEAAAKAFFGDSYETKDLTDAKFESGVANDFLAMSKGDREKVARTGPITAAAIRQFREKGKDPLKLVSEAIKEAKKALPRKTGGKKAPPVIQPDAFTEVSDRLDQLAQDEQVDESVKAFTASLCDIIASDADSHATVKELQDRIKEFEKQRKEGAPAAEPESRKLEATGA